MVPEDHLVREKKLVRFLYVRTRLAVGDPSKKPTMQRHAPPCRVPEIAIRCAHMISAMTVGAKCNFC